MEDSKDSEVKGDGTIVIRNHLTGAEYVSFPENSTSNPSVTQVGQDQEGQNS